MDYEKEIPFGAFDSELMHEEISIPEGFEAEIKGNKIILKKIESEDERIRKVLVELVKCNERCGYFMINNTTTSAMLAWLEKQGNEPNWCHHKVDLSGCSEEYRKAYYDGWNNCNHQHSQCKSEWNDVVKCLINGMKFYYEDNEEATWGTEKFSMKVKDILSWLEKQGGQKPAEKAEPKFKVKYAGSEYNVFETKDIAGVTFYGIEDEPNHIDYVKAENCEIISVYAIKENGSPYPTKPAVFSEQKPQRMISAEAKEALYDKPAYVWREEDDKMCQETIDWFEKKCFPYAIGEENPAKDSINWLKSIKQKIKGE